jgi:hypothetical protein
MKVVECIQQIVSLIEDIMACTQQQVLVYKYVRRMNHARAHVLHLNVLVLSLLML